MIVVHQFSMIFWFINQRSEINISQWSSTMVSHESFCRGVYYLAFVYRIDGSRFLWFDHCRLFIGLMEVVHVGLIIVDCWLLVWYLLIVGWFFFNFWFLLNIPLLYKGNHGVGSIFIANIIFFKEFNQVSFFKFDSFIEKFPQDYSTND